MAGQHGTNTAVHPHHAHHAPAHPSTAPKVTLSFTPPGPEYAISETADMPLIKASATLANVTVKPGDTLEFNWSAKVEFNGHRCPHAMGRTTAHPPIHAKTQPGDWIIPFTQTRGGALTVTVSVQVNHHKLSATSAGLHIVGTNPTPASLLCVSYPNETFKKLMRLESGLVQFRGHPGGTSKCPLFSSDNLGGVGLCQITRPRPTDDEVWDWTANVEAGKRFWDSKEANSRAFVTSQRTGDHFQGLVNDFNHRRAQHHLPAIAVTLPDFTDDQIEKDTLRGYNGYAGGWHEYRIATDAHGHLVVTIDPGGTKGAAEWHHNTAAERRAHYQAIGLDTDNWGDPDYVEDVLKQASF